MSQQVCKPNSVKLPRLGKIRARGELRNLRFLKPGVGVIYGDHLSRRATFHKSSVCFQNPWFALAPSKDLAVSPLHYCRARPPSHKATEGGLILSN